MAARIALHLGAGGVLGLDLVPERLNMAARHGVETIDVGGVDDAKEVVIELTDGRGADATIDAVGMEASGSVVDSVLTTAKIQTDKTHVLRQALASTRRGGTVSISGVYTGPVQMFPLGDLFDMQIQLRRARRT